MSKKQPFVEIWIASHLNQSLRCELFTYALQSIQSQVIKPNKVYISITIDYGNQQFCHQYLENIKNILKNIDVTILRHDEQLVQFEHFNEIYKVSEHIDDKWIMFCDDDDLNSNDRIKSFIDELNISQKLAYSSGLFYWSEQYQEPCQTYEYAICNKYCFQYGDKYNLCEMGTMFVNFKLICEFFDSIHLYLYGHTTDLLFVMWLEKKYNITKISGLQYMYRRNFLLSRSYDVSNTAPDLLEIKKRLNLCENI